MFGWLFATIAILCIVIEVFKDIVIANTYGISGISDAYFYAFQIPYICLFLYGATGGPFHKATISILSNKISDITKQPTKDVQNIINSLITLTGTSLLVISVLTYLFSGQIIKFIMPGSALQIQNLATINLQIMSPAIFIGGLIGIFRGLSNIYDRFVFSSLSPAITSIIVIVALLVSKGDKTGIIIAQSTLIGAITLFIVQLALLRKNGFSYKPRFAYDKKRLKDFLNVIAPAIITIIMMQIVIFTDMFFASGLQTGSWSAYIYAHRLLQLPVELIIIALFIPLFPLIPVSDKNQNLEEHKYYFTSGLGFLWYLTFPVLAFIGIFSQEIIKIFYQNKIFYNQDLVLIAGLLVILAISIIPFIIKNIIIRTFSSLKDSKMIYYATIFSVFSKICLNYLFIIVFSLGINGLAISTVIATCADAYIYSELLKKRIHFEYKPIVYNFFDLLWTTVLMSLVTFSLKYYINFIAPGLPMPAQVLLCFVISITVYIVLGLLLHVYEASLLVNKIKDLFENKSTTSQYGINQEVENTKNLIQTHKTDINSRYEKLEDEKQKTESLIENMLPGQIATQLKETGKVEPIQFESASVMFSDFQDFTKLSKEISATELIKELDCYFNAFDQITGKHRLEKIKTIGDSYMCVGGVPEINKTHAIDCVLAAFDFLQFVKLENLERISKNKPQLNIRIGINTGSIIAGVLGQKKSTYDVWGDAVNMASRLESYGIAGEINISSSTYGLIKEFFNCTYRGAIEVKNAGEIKMYIVNAIKPEFAKTNFKYLPNDKFLNLIKR